MKWFFVCLAAVHALGYHASASAQSGQKLVAAYSSLSATQATLWLAKEAGAFQRHGLDVELIYISTGTKMVQALVGGDIRISQVGGAAPLAARLRGAEIKIIAVAFNTLALSMITQTDIRAITDLKGKRLGISRFGSNTDFGTRYLLKKHNIADRDVTFLQFGEAQALREFEFEKGPVDFFGVVGVGAGALVVLGVDARLGRGRQQLPDRW